MRSKPSRLANLANLANSANVDDLASELLVEFELAFANPERFDPGLKSGWRNPEPGRRP